MRELGIADETKLQSYFVQRIEKFLSARGRRLIGWDEILEGGIAPNATVMSWRGIDGAVAAARAGHDAVLAPGPTLYLDNRQSANQHNPPGRGYVLPIEEIYAFDPSRACSQPASGHTSSASRQASGRSTSALRSASISWPGRAARRWRRSAGRRSSGATSTISCSGSFRSSGATARAACRMPTCCSV
jgi:hypothetical protein